MDIDDPLYSITGDKKSFIDERILELEKELQQYNTSTLEEINYFALKRKNLEQSFDLLDKLETLDEYKSLELKLDYKNRVKEIKERQEENERVSKLIKIDQLQSMIGNSKAGANQFQGSSVGDSYLANLQYYQNQLNNLISSLES